MGKFTKQKSGLYRTTIQLGYGPDGKPIKKYLSATTIKDLEKKIMEARSDISNGLVVSDTTTFGQYSSEWLNIYKAHKGIQTRNMYKRSLDRAAELNDIQLRKVNRLMIQKIINDNAEHPRTCELTLLTLKQVFKSAREDGMVGKSPCEGIELPRHVPNEKRALLDDEKEKLRSAILQPKERLLLLLLYGTGCRPSEAYALNKSDIDFKAGIVKINKSVQFNGNYFYSVSHPKTNASIRSVIVSDSILRSLKHIVDKLPHDNLLADDNGQYGNYGYYQYMFKRILRKAGLTGSGITQYTFRHNFCTECWYNGISIKECMKLMGHKDYKMILEVYSHLDEMKENTKEKMARMIM